MNETQIAGLVLLILGGLHVARPDWVLQFQTGAQRVIMGARYEPGPRTYRVTRIIGAAVMALGLFAITGAIDPNRSNIPETSREGLFLDETSSRDGLTFRRLKDFGLAVADYQILVKSYIPPCDGDFDYCYYYLGNKYEGTNFESAGIRVKKRADLAAREACLNTPPEGREGLPPKIKQEAGYATSVFSPLGDAAAGHYTRGALYRLSYGLPAQAGGGCYEFETRIGESQFANYEPGAIRLFTDADRADMEALLRAFVGAVRFTETGESPAFPNP